MVNLMLLMTDEKTQLTWHTVWTLFGILVGVVGIAVQISLQYDSFRATNETFHETIAERLTKLETELDLVQKHIDNIQYQLDHERAVH